MTLAISRSASCFSPHAGAGLDPTLLVVRILCLVCFVLPLGGCGYAGLNERDTFPEACTVPDSELAQIQEGPFQRLTRARKAVVYLAKEDRYALLEMPNCRLTRLADVPNRAGLASFMQIASSGARFFRTYAPTRPALPLWYAPDSATVPVEVPLCPQ